MRRHATILPGTATRPALGSSVPVGRVIQSLEIAGVLVVRDDVALHGYEAATGAHLWTRENALDAVLHGLVGARPVLVGHEKDELRLALLDPRTGDVDVVFALAESMRYVPRTLAWDGTTARFVTDHKTLTSVDFARRSVDFAVPLVADRVLPVVVIAAEAFVATTLDGPRGVRTVVSAVARDGSLRPDLDVAGDAYALVAGTRALCAQVVRAPAFDARTAYAWLPGHGDRAIALPASGRAILDGDQIVLRAEKGVTYVIEPRGEELEVRTSSVVDIRRLPAAPPPASPPSPSSVILPPRRPPQSGEHRRLEALAALGFLDERGALPSPRYEELVRAYYTDSALRWRIETLGLTLRDPRVRWADGGDVTFTVFGETADGAALGFLPGGGVARRAPASEVATPIAHDFDAFLASLLAAARASRPGPVAMVMTALALDDAWLAESSRS